MNYDLISIIIPVYKVEKHLARCIDSVLNQTYQNIEIILVNDGSPDNCGDICDEYATIDNRIKVIHKENGGLSDARNCGVEIANGAFITFIDSDDFIAQDFIEFLYQLLCKYNADISSCCMTMTNTDYAEYGKITYLPEEQLLTGKEATMGLLGDLYIIFVTACGKLYRSDIVKKHPFPVGKKHEDEATTAKFLINANKVALSNRELYAYYQNENSITHTKGNKKNEDAIWSIHHRAEYLESLGEYKLSQKAYEFLFDYLAKDSVFNHRRCDSDIERLLKGKKLTLRWEIYKVLHKVSLRLYRIVRRF